MKPAVKENDVPTTANEPDHHGDVNLLIFGSAHHKVSNHTRGRCITNGLNGIVRRCCLCKQRYSECQTKSSKQQALHYVLFSMGFESRALCLGCEVADSANQLVEVPERCVNMRSNSNATDVLPHNTDG